MPQKRKNSVETLVVGNLQTNCLLFIKSNRDCLIIDPGDDAEYILNRINDLELNPKAIIATHGHFDHIISVNELKHSLCIPFLMNKKDEKLLLWFRKSTKHFVNKDPGPRPIVDQYLGKIKNSFLDSFSLEVISTPGHTPGSVSLYSENDSLIFSGDLIFKGGFIGRTDLPYSDKKQILKSIEKVLTLPDHTIVYTGHGEHTTIGQFKKEFLKYK